MSHMRGAEVRAQLKHPVIDADGHWLELNPIFFEYVGKVAGSDALEYMHSRFGRRHVPWYSASGEERRRNRMTRPFYWGTPAASALERAAAIVPAIFRDRLDDWGIDVAVVFPSMGLGLSRELAHTGLVTRVVAAYNTMVADMFRRYSDRIIPVGVVALDTPEEAIRQLEHAHSLGLKLVCTGGSIPRSFEVDQDWQTDPRKRRVYIDGLAMDSSHDYDPVWRRFMDLKIPVATHSGSMGWPDRSSPSNFVANHLGHFAQSHHLFARSLFLGGVTERFPGLNFGFLEGGVGWACSLLADLRGHWEKRNRKFMDEHLKPTRLDRGELRRLMETWTGADPLFEGKIDDIVTRNLESSEFNLSAEEAARRNLDSDDFSQVSIQSKADIERLFSRNFYFGCEADDPMTAVAFDEKMGLRLKPVLGSDISHFDVIDPTKVLGEAWEMVEHRLINEANFRDFTFGNAVELFAGMNPDFFKGTLVERAARRELDARGKSQSR